MGSSEKSNGWLNDNFNNNNGFSRLTDSCLSDGHPKGAVLFTGPDGIRDHRVYVEDEHRFVGDDTMSPEGTSDVNYLWRATTGMFTARPKSAKVGEIGWGLNTFVDNTPPLTGKQIVLGEFRQATEDRHTHLYQNSWYPGPDEEYPESSDAGQVMNVYRPQSQGRPRTSHSRGRARPTTPAQQPQQHYGAYSGDHRRTSDRSLSSYPSNHQQRSSLPEY